MKSQRAKKLLKKFSWGRLGDNGMIVSTSAAEKAVYLAELEARERAVRAHAQTCSEYRSGVCYDDPNEIVDCKPEDCATCKEFLSHYDCDYEY